MDVLPDHTSMNTYRAHNYDLTATALVFLPDSSHLLKVCITFTVQIVKLRATAMVIRHVWDHIANQNADEKWLCSPPYLRPGSKSSQSPRSEFGKVFSHKIVLSRFIISSQNIQIMFAISFLCVNHVMKVI